MAVSAVGYAGIAVWMGLTIYAPGGIAYQGKGYLQGLVNSIGQDAGAKVDDSNLAPIVRQLKESLEKSAPVTDQAIAGGSRADLIATLRNNYNIDNVKKPAELQQDWTGSGLQVLAWHYDKSLGRWFNMPEKNDRLAAIMTTAAKILFFVVIAAMLLMIYAARSTRSVFYWLLVLLPAAVSPGFIVEYSAWLWWYGHSLNEMGAFTLKPFMPTVFGEGKVAQFTTYSYPHYGFGLMVASTLVLLLAALIRRKQIIEAGSAAEGI
jgi:triacylglycerol esterase/lipase EstA (alpha/beta hydrolase family)